MRTYDEWKAIGMQVQRGQRAVGHDKHGRALFSERQVAPYQDPDDYDYEHWAEMADAMGYDHMDFGDR